MCDVWVPLIPWDFLRLLRNIRKKLRRNLNFFFEKKNLWKNFLQVALEEFLKKSLKDSSIYKGINVWSLWKSLEESLENQKYLRFFWRNTCRDTGIKGHSIFSEISRRMFRRCSGKRDAIHGRFYERITREFTEVFSVGISLLFFFQISMKNFIIPSS